MRLSEWRSAAPHKDGAAPKVAAVVDPVLSALGAGPDPHCWVAWGDEPGNRYSILVPTDPGLIVTFVRANVPGEGPRATTKLVRWSRVAIGELSVETQGGHRMLSFQVEGQVLRGVDVEADRVAAFALRVIAAIDGRPLPPVEETRRRGASRATGKPVKPGKAAAKAAPGSATAKAPAKPAARPGTTPAGPGRSAPKALTSGTSR
jgi:hypothetical protein